MTSGHPTSRTKDISGYPTGADAPLRATESALIRVEGAKTIILVEGVSDQIAVETLAARLGHDFDEVGAVVLPIGGATAIGAYTERFADSGVQLIGLCDVAEASHYSSALTRAGELLSSDAKSRFFVCDADLEDELIRALGSAATEAVLESERDLGAFRTLQKQASWSDEPFDRQMRRWLGAGARRKSRYAKLFVGALEDERIPEPLMRLLDAIES